MAQLVYDVIVRFCDLYIDRCSCTHDQMVQAARSGVQNIAEGSQVSGTWKKMGRKGRRVKSAILDGQTFIKCSSTRSKIGAGVCPTVIPAYAGIDPVKP